MSARSFPRKRESRAAAALDPRFRGGERSERHRPVSPQQPARARVAAGALPSLITATTAPTLAVSPTWKRMSVSVPALVAGTSIEVLSVSISNRFSPGFTLSPADLNHFTILPSATVSPSCGISTSIYFPRVT